MPFGQKVVSGGCQHAGAVRAYPLTPGASRRVSVGYIVAALLLALAAAGCSTRSVPLEDAPLPFRQAEDNFRLGNYEKAVRGYQVFLDSASSDEYEELVPRAYYRMAMSEYRRGRYNECLAVLDRMSRRLPRQGLCAGGHAARRRRAGAR